MSHYYGDDGDLGERMDADAQMAALEAAARRARKAERRELALASVLAFLEAPLLVQAPNGSWRWIRERDDYPLRPCPTNSTFPCQHDWH